jgi:hypothetical protein
MSIPQDGSEQLDVAATLAAAATLAFLMVKIGSATADEIPALADEAKRSAQIICAFSGDTLALEYLGSNDAAELRAGLEKLSRDLQVQIAGVVDLRRAQLANSGVSSTRH